MGAGADAPDEPRATDEALLAFFAARDVAWLDDHEGGSLEGVFRPRADAIPLARLRTLLRSWELFDRAYEPLVDVDAEALVAARLAGRGLGLVRHDDETAERLAHGLLVFSDGLVVALDAEAWSRVLAGLYETRGD